MLMNHKNFRFTQIPDKTNDTIFLKSPKTLFLGHFWPFLVIFARWGFFPKNLALSHVTIYGPLTPCKVPEKTNEPILRKLTDRRKDEQKDGRTLFYRTLLTEAGSLITLRKQTKPKIQAWKFGGKDRFVTASFPSLIKYGNDNSFPQIDLHNKNAFFEDLTGKHFYNLAYTFYILIFQRCTNERVLPQQFRHYRFI